MSKIENFRLVITRMKNLLP